MTTRRAFLHGAAIVGASLVSRAQAAPPDAPTQSQAATQPPPVPSDRRRYNPVVTLNGWSLPWRMRDGVAARPRGVDCGH